MSGAATAPLSAAAVAAVTQANVQAAAAPTSSSKGFWNFIPMAIFNNDDDTAASAVSTPTKQLQQGAGRPAAATATDLVLPSPETAPAGLITTGKFNTGSISGSIARPVATSAAVAQPSGADKGNTTVKDKIKAEHAEQFANTDYVVFHMLLACAAILIAVIVIVHPRFLTRIFASMHRKRAAHTEAGTRPAYAFDPKTQQEGSSGTVWRAPRTVAGGDLGQGWFLRKGNRKPNRMTTAVNLALGIESDPLATTKSSLGSGRRLGRASLAPPPHLAPLTSRLPAPIVRFLDWAPFVRMPGPLFCRADIRTLIVILTYVGFIFVACIWKSDVRPKKNGAGYGSDFSRTGMVSTVMVPVVIALGVRGNLVGLLIGKSYDRLRIFHKFVGRVVFVTGALHSCFFIQKWAAGGTFFKSAASPIGITGFVAFGALVLITISSLPYFRRAAYRFFQICHFIGIVSLLVGLGFHVPQAMPWCIAGGAIYAFSWFWQLLKMRRCQAELVALGGSTTTLITIPGLTTGWRAGQHVRLRVFGLGMTSAFEAHPLTIASAPDCDGLVLMVKAAGDWSTKLYDLAASGSGKAIGDAEVGQWKRTTTVMVEGPYGGPGHTLPLAFSSLVLIAGGSGITHSLGIAQDLINRSPSGVVAARTIDIVWTVRIQQTARAIMPMIQSLVDQARAWERRAIAGRRNGADLAPPTALRVHVFVTRCPASSPLTLVAPDRPFDTDRGAKEGKLISPFPMSPIGHGLEDDEELDESLDGHSNDTHGSSDSHGSSEGHTSEWLTPHSARRSEWRDTISQFPYGPSMPNPESPAERTKADWLQRNPSQSRVSRVVQPKTNASKTMSLVKAYRGRPDFANLIEGIADETMSRHGREFTDPTGVFVTACGPEFLVNDTRDACRKIAPFKSKACGGIEFEAEFFGF